MPKNSSDDAKGDADEVKLRILHITDTYTLVNFPHLVTLIEQKREEFLPHKTISIMTGDFLAPYLLSSLDQGVGMIECLNRLPIDYVIFGNHENDLDHNEVVSRVREYEGTWINSNMPDYEANFPEDRGSSVKSDGTGSFSLNKGESLGFLVEHELLSSSVPEVTSNSLAVSADTLSSLSRFVAVSENDDQKGSSEYGEQKRRVGDSPTSEKSFGGAISVASTDDTGFGMKRRNRCCKEYAILELQSINGKHTRKVGMVGVLSADNGLYNLGAWGGAELLDPWESLSYWRKELVNNENGEKVDWILPLCHLYEDQDEKTLREFDFPLVLSGHDHHIVDKIVEGSRLIKPGQDAKKCYCIDITWDKHGSMVHNNVTQHYVSGEELESTRPKVKTAWGETTAKPAGNADATGATALDISSATSASGEVAGYSPRFPPMKNPDKIDCDLLDVKSYPASAEFTQFVKKKYSVLDGMNGTQLCGIPDRFRPCVSTSARTRPVTLATFLCTMIRDSMNYSDKYVQHFEKHQDHEGFDHEETEGEAGFNGQGFITPTSGKERSAGLMSVKTALTFDEDAIEKINAELKEVKVLSDENKDERDDKHRNEKKDKEKEIIRCSSSPTVDGAVKNGSGTQSHALVTSKSNQPSFPRRWSCALGDISSRQEQERCFFRKRPVEQERKKIVCRMVNKARSIEARDQERDAISQSVRSTNANSVRKSSRKRNPGTPCMSLSFAGRSGRVKRLSAMSMRLGSVKMTGVGSDSVLVTQQKSDSQMTTPFGSGQNLQKAAEAAHSSKTGSKFGSHHGIQSVSFAGFATESIGDAATDSIVPTKGIGSTIGESSQFGKESIGMSHQCSSFRANQEDFPHTVDCVIVNGGSIGRGEKEYDENAFFSLADLESELEDGLCLIYVKVPGYVLKRIMYEGRLKSPSPGYLQCDEGVVISNRIPCDVDENHSTRGFRSADNQSTNVESSSTNSGQNTDGASNAADTTGDSSSSESGEWVEYGAITHVNYDEPVEDDKIYSILTTKWDATSGMSASLRNYIKAENIKLDEEGGRQAREMLISTFAMNVWEQMLVSADTSRGSNGIGNSATSRLSGGSILSGSAGSSNPGASSLGASGAPGIGASSVPGTPPRFSPASSRSGSYPKIGSKLSRTVVASKNLGVGRKSGFPSGKSRVPGVNPLDTDSLSRYDDPHAILEQSPFVEGATAKGGHVSKSDMLKYMKKFGINVEVMEMGFVNKIMEQGTKMGLVQHDKATGNFRVSKHIARASY